jgi:predicted transcriptional regulator
MAESTTTTTDWLPAGSAEVLSAVPPTGAPPMTSSEIGRAIGRSQGWVNIRLRALARHGLVTGRQEHGGRKHWSRSPVRFRRPPARGGA